MKLLNKALFITSVCALSAWSQMGSAKPVELIEGYAVSQPEFKTADIDASRPLLVDVLSTEEDTCHFTVALVVLQGGGGLTGRVEKGICQGKSVSEGIVRADYSTLANGNARLERQIDVVILK